MQIQDNQNIDSPTTVILLRTIVSGDILPIFNANLLFELKMGKPSPETIVLKVRSLELEFSDNLTYYISIYIYKRKSQNVCVTPFITQERLYLC